MSWSTVLYGGLTGFCAAMAIPYLILGVWRRRVVDLLFVLATAAVIAAATLELAMMHASSPNEYITAVRWIHLPVFVLTVAIIGFVQLYFGTGRRWLALLAVGIRLLALVINFTAPINLNFQAMTGLRRVPFLGDLVAMPVGTMSPWTRLGELASLLVLIFVIDASVRLWRQGTVLAKRRALLVGGSIALFIIMAAGRTTLINLGVSEGPYLISFPFVAIVTAMGLELGYNIFAAATLARKLKVSEASRAESETRFQTMADAAPVLIWKAGPDKTCDFFNHKWLEFTGRTLEQEMGNGWRESVHPGDLEACRAQFGNVFEERKPIVMQYRLRRHDGEYRWVTDSGVPRYDADGEFTGYVGACVDITDLREKDRALKDVEDRISIAAQAAQLGIWELNTKTEELWVSPSARQLFQFSPNEEIKYETFQARVHPEDREWRDTIVSNAIETCGEYEIEYRVALPDGTMRWMAARGRCISDAGGGCTCRLLAVSMDVTERKQAEELFQLATEASPSGILMVSEDGLMVLVNAHVEELFGYSRSELLGKSIELLLPGSLGREHACLSPESFTSPEKRATERPRELSGHRKNGEEFPVEVGLNPIQTPKGNLILVSVTNLTRRKRAEAEAQRHAQEISRLSRISLLGEMTASIAHELNQPLSGIMSNASAGQRFIDRGSVDPQRLREIMVDIVADGRRAHDVIWNIRKTLKGAMVRQRVNLNDVVTSVSRMLEPEARARSCELKLALAEKLPAIEIDPTQIQQVLINLVSNAFDAMKVTPVEDRKVEIKTEQHNGTIDVSVRDHGIGIPEGMREQLFEQFFTTKEDGLGLGLSIVRSIIESHGGDIAVENVTEGGARFRFSVPVGNGSSG